VNFNSETLQHPSYEIEFYNNKNHSAESPVILYMRFGLPQEKDASSINPKVIEHTQVTRQKFSPFTLFKAKYTLLWIFILKLNFGVPTFILLFSCTM